MSVHSFVSPSFSVLFTKEREKISNNIKIAILVSDVDKIVKVKGVPVGAGAFECLFSLEHKLQISNSQIVNLQ